MTTREAMMEILVTCEMERMGVMAAEDAMTRVREYAMQCCSEELRESLATIAPMHG